MPKPGKRLVAKMQAAIVSRPTARMSDDGLTVEVTRCVTDGTKNACSALYGACVRAALALGYKRIITYTLPKEGGASLRGAGWRCLGQAGGGSWSRKSRPRVDNASNRTEAIMGRRGMIVNWIKPRSSDADA